MVEMFLASEAQVPSLIMTHIMSHLKCLYDLEL